MLKHAERNEKWLLGDRTAQHVVGLALITLLVLFLLVYSVFVSLSATRRGIAAKTSSPTTQQSPPGQR